MKKIIFIIITVTIYSCKNTVPDNQIKSTDVKTELEGDYEMVDMFLEFDAEKVALLSMLKEIPNEKANFVLRDYLAKTSSSLALESMDNPLYFVKLVDTIAENHGLSRKLAASIIFSYQYEMITEDEIIEQYSNEREYFEEQ